jgi:hypothetical protein|tara:strand:+ start:356 stop:517 length:162 start_codon:yes stop_codon:yes gene_type:complete
MKIGDYVKIKEYYKEAGRKGIIIDIRRGWLVMRYTTGEIHLVTAAQLDLISSA